MKKAMLRKIRQMSEEVLGEEKTNEIIDKTIQEVIKETKPKKKTKKGEK